MPTSIWTFDMFPHAVTNIYLHQHMCFHPLDYVIVLHVCHCMWPTFIFVYICGLHQHFLWTVSIFTLISCNVYGCRRCWCCDVIVRPSGFDLMVVVQMQHVGWEPGMQMKSNERHLKNGSDAANNLKHTYAWCHARWYVLDVCCWMFENVRLKTNCSKSD